MSTEQLFRITLLNHVPGVTRLFVLMTVFIFKPLLGFKHRISKCNLITVSIQLVRQSLGNLLSCMNVVNRTADKTKHMVVLDSDLIQYSYLKCIQ